jgi:hypothetical protein
MQQSGGRQGTRSQFGSYVVTRHPGAGQHTGRRGCHDEHRTPSRRWHVAEERAGRCEPIPVPWWRSPTRRAPPGKTGRSRLRRRTRERCGTGRRFTTTTG